MKKRIINFAIAFVSLLSLSSCGDDIIQHYHYYDPDTQQWNWEYDEKGYPIAATMSLKCDNLDAKCPLPLLTLNANITKEFVEEENCCESGLLRYIAKATYNDTTYTKCKDYPIEKSAHNFEDYFANELGHAKECEYCHMLEKELEEHSYGISGEEYYTCSICDYVSFTRKEEYEKGAIIREIEGKIAQLQQPIAPYHEAKIREINKLCSELSDADKEKITGYTGYLTYKNLYNKQFEIIFSDTLDSYGYNTVSKSTEVEITSTRNQVSEYGYGYSLNVVTKSHNNEFRLKTSAPNYSKDDGYTGVFYTYNIPSDTTVRIINNKGDFMVGGTDNVDLGNGWVQRNINETRMQNLVSYSYEEISFILGIDEATTVDEGEYFISCVYAIKPEQSDNGYHYIAKESTSTETGNKEYWMYDNSSKVYLSNPDLSVNWEDKTSPALNEEHPAFIGAKKTTNVVTTDGTNWTSSIQDPNNKHSLSFGKTGTGEDGGLFALFKNYQWKDWKESQIGLTAEYQCEEVNYVNTFCMTYYLFNPVSPVKVTINIVDQLGAKTEVLHKYFEHCPNGPVTEEFTFKATNFKSLEISTHAFTNGKDGYSNISIKDVSAYYIEPGETVGTHYLYNAPTATSSGNKEYWVFDGDSNIYFENPDPTSIWDDSSIASISSSHPAYLAKTGNAQVETSSGTNWNAPKEGPIRTEYGQTIGSHSGTCMTFRNCQYASFKETELGITAIYTNPNPIMSVNNIAFNSYVWRENSTLAKANLNVKIYIIDQVGTETMIDEFVLDKNDTEWLNYHKDFDLSNFYQLKIVTTSEYILLSSDFINTIMYVDNLQLYYEKQNIDEVTIPTTSSEGWTSSTPAPQNKVVYGTEPKYENAGPGDYIGLRNYQWFDWKENQVGITATYQLNEPTVMNTINLKYFINEASFEAPSGVLTISVIDNYYQKVDVDSITIDKTLIEKETDIDYTKTLDNKITVKQFVLSFKSFSSSLKSGGYSTAIFIRDIVCSYSY